MFLCSILFTLVLHVELNLYRPIQTNVQVWQSWGSPAVVVDPWINCVFPVPRIPIYWEYIANFYRWGEQDVNLPYWVHNATPIFKTQSLYDSENTPINEMYFILARRSLFRIIKAISQSQFHIADWAFN